ncbi:LCP family protein [Stackebrandtia nassauensis]|uniref:Cell envelope-related transcriptional attenuator n=1 Tax=Stackebrandtia nassauensis (strain DSM 44728 / CIP 108903 / NRRL B-16338 / NBRC 102104 / LLR-40K-21) TaxID=446470 RepID=D3PXB8_STANL|nr:LCP family protein [Stackebrandtia nassauensis]ADD41381.1 cell envelope-related transcriptional attenuator [Stackebrandtia nassauensis DSM 44728]
MAGRRRSSTAKRGNKAPLWAKFMVGIGAILLVTSIGGVTFGIDMISRINSIGSADTGIAQDEDGKITEGPLNILLVGADLRVKKNNTPLADTIMIMHINKSLTKANIVSIPRDLKVPMEGGGNCTTGECMDKINSSYTLGFNKRNKPEDGLTNLRKVLTDYTGIKFQANGLVNFEGFLDVVKTFGGIELCLDHDLDTAHGGFYKKGCRQYKPDDALAIVRERYAWPDGDYGRQRMQQHFVKQLLKEAMKRGYAKNPGKLGDLIDQIGSQMRMDLGGVKPVDYAIALRGIKADKMKTVKLPSGTSEEIVNGTKISYVVVGEDQQQDAQGLFEAIKGDTLDDWIESNPDYLNQDPKDGA